MDGHEVSLREIGLVEFPAELFDLICKQCDQMSLKHLSLTHSRLRRPAQTWLFQGVSISITQPRCKTVEDASTFSKELLAILTSASTVRRLTLKALVSANDHALIPVPIVRALKSFFSSPKVALSSLDLSVASHSWSNQIETILVSLVVKPSHLTISKWPTEFSPGRFHTLLKVWPDVVLEVPISSVEGPAEADTSYLMHLNEDGSQHLHALELVGKHCEGPWDDWLKPSLLASLSTLTFTICDAEHIGTFLQAANGAQCHIGIESISVTACVNCDTWELPWSILVPLNNCPNLRSAELFLHSYALHEELFSFEELPSSLRHLSLTIEPHVNGIEVFLDALAKAAGSLHILPNLQTFEIHTSWACHEASRRQYESDNPDMIDESHLEEAFKAAKAARVSPCYPGDPRNLMEHEDARVWRLDEDIIYEAAAELSVKDWADTCNESIREAMKGLSQRDIKHNLCEPFPVDDESS